MPPKAKFTREEILAAGLAVVRREGMGALTARSLAAELGTSPKPIFGLFPTMEAVQQGVLTQADRLYQEYLRTDMAQGKYPAYKASGMAYIRFAREEPELFRLLFMRDRRQESIPQEQSDIEPLITIIQKNLGISREKALLFHMEMWVFVHGIATMLATQYLPWEDSFISDCLTDAYQGLKTRFWEGTP